MEYKEAKEIFNKIYADNMDKEALVSLLKENNVTQSHTTMLLCKELNIPFFEADDIVLYSKAWDKFRDTNLKGRNEIIDELDKE